MLLAAASVDGGPGSDSVLGASEDAECYQMPDQEPVARHARFETPKLTKTRAHARRRSSSGRRARAFLSSQCEANHSDSTSAQLVPIGQPLRGSYVVPLFRFEMTILLLRLLRLLLSSSVRARASVCVKGQVTSRASR